MMAQQILAVACPDCGRKYRWVQTAAGRNIVCKCGATFMMPRSEPPTINAETTASGTTLGSSLTDATTFGSTGVGQSSNPPSEAVVPTKEGFLKSLKHDFVQEVVAADTGAKADITTAADVNAQNFCPRCRSLIPLGSQDCKRCGYTADRTEFYNPFKDKYVASFIWGGLVCLVLPVVFGWIAYFAGYELGFLFIVISRAIIRTMRKVNPVWAHWHRLAAYSYVVLGCLLFRTAEYSWVPGIDFVSWIDCAYVPITAYLTYLWVKKASQQQIITVR